MDGVTNSNVTKVCILKNDLVLPNDNTTGGLWISDVDTDIVSLYDTSTGFIKKQFDVYDSRGSLGFTSDGDLIIAFSHSWYNDVLYYKHPLTNGMNPSYNFFTPPSGITDFNYLSIRGLFVPKSIVVTDTQLIISTSPRLVYWNTPNGLLDIFSGRSQDGVAGITSIEADPETDFLVNFERIGSDGSFLYVIHSANLEIYQLPLTGTFSNGTMPNRIIPFTEIEFVNGYLLNDTILLTGIAVDPNGLFMWISSPTNDAAVRIRIPTDKIGGQYLIDAVISGKPGTSLSNPIPVYDGSFNHPCAPTNSSVCNPGSLTLDKQNWLWISNYSLENAGTGRLIGFELDNIVYPLNTGSVPSTLQLIDVGSASKVFEEVYPWQSAFDSKNRMVIGGAGFTGRSDRPYYYFNVTELSSIPSNENGTFLESTLQPYGIYFDSNDNLYIADMNRGRVIIYLTPFSSPSSSEQVVSQSSQMIMNFVQYLIMIMIFS